MQNSSENSKKRNLFKELEQSIEEFDAHDRGEVELQTNDLLDPIPPGQILLKDFMEPLGRRELLK